MIRQQRLRVELPAVLALGSNLGDREATLREAVAAIAAIDGVRVVAASGLVETPALKPHGIDVEAPAYLNAVLAIRSALPPHELLAELAAIERELGRVRLERWGDRTIDIDIVAIDGLEQSDDTLTLPHPRAWERGFVLVPWLQIEPDAELPGHGRVADLPAAGDADVRSYSSKGLL